MALTSLSQRDPKWAGLRLGFSQDSIGGKGCTITGIAMLAGLSPDEVNERLKRVNGFSAPKDSPSGKNLVIWLKVNEAIPWLEFIERGYQYDNEKVKKNLPCLVEVDGKRIGAPKHWVVYVGNQKMSDPWYGTEKATVYYPPIGFATFKIKERSETPITDNDGKLTHLYRPGDENEDPHLLRRKRDENWQLFLDAKEQIDEYKRDMDGAAVSINELRDQLDGISKLLNIENKQETRLSEIRKLIAAEDGEREAKKLLDESQEENLSLKEQVQGLTTAKEELERRLGDPARSHAPEIAPIESKGGESTWQKLLRWTFRLFGKG